MARQRDERQRNEARRRAEAAPRTAAREAGRRAARVAPHLEELHELRAAQVEAEQLGAIAMHRARKAGASWSAIGGAWGVSPQAAQQRHQRLLKMFPDLDARLGA